MAIGTVRGPAVSTNDLEPTTLVVLDNELFVVDNVAPLANRAPGDMVVRLLPPHGPTWEVEVRAEDVDEPMWELA